MAMLRWLILVAFVALLTGCGATHHERRVERVEPGSEWKRENGGALRVWLSGGRLRGDQLEFEVQQALLEREFAFETVYNQVRTVKDADATMLVAAVPMLGMNCLLIKDGCLGATGYWRPDGSEVRNRRATGRTREVTVLMSDTTTSQFRMEAFDASGKSLGQRAVSSYTSDGRTSVGLRDFAQSLPQHPHQLQVDVKLPNKVGTPGARYTVEPAQVVAMSLKREEWLPDAERRQIYSERLRTALLAGNHAEALKQFAALESLAGELPNSFYFKYAQSLAATGDMNRARAYARRYLDKSGTSGTYLAEARALAN